MTRKEGMAVALTAISRLGFVLERKVIGLVSLDKLPTEIESFRGTQPTAVRILVDIAL